MGILNEIYKSFFSKDYSAIWQQFAKEQGGKYVPISDHRVQFSHKDFLLTFDAYTHYISVGGRTSDSYYTRGILEFKTRSAHRLLLTKQGFFENISKLFGAQDIKIGDRSFDKKFMVKSNNEAKTLMFLSNSTLTAALENLAIVRFEITDGTGLWDEKPEEGNFMIYVVMEGSVKQIGQLNQLLELFSAAIDGIS